MQDPPATVIVVAVAVVVVVVVVVVAAAAGVAVFLQRSDILFLNRELGKILLTRSLGVNLSTSTTSPEILKVGSMEGP